jgi:hypothetical protein
MGEFGLRRSPIAPLLLVLILLLSAVPSPAEEGIVLDAGEWKFDFSVKMPMQSEPSHQVFQSCLASDPIGPSTLMPWAEEQNCRIRGIKVEQNKLTWKIICNMHSQIARGKGEFESSGDDAKGKAKIAFEIGGQRMFIKAGWNGKRLGACPAGVSGGVDPPAESEPGE